MITAGLVSDFGDLFPALAVALVVFAWCWAKLDRLMAMTFAVCLGGTVVVVTLLKLASAQLFADPDGTGLFSFSSGAPSGHTAMAVIVYGAALLLFATSCRGLLAVAGGLWSGAVLLAVSVTRVTLHAHTIADVLGGLAVAGGFLVLFERVRARRDHPREDGALSLLAGVMVVGLIALASGVRISNRILL